MKRHRLVALLFGFALMVAHPALAVTVQIKSSTKLIDNGNTCSGCTINVDFSGISPSVTDGQTVYINFAIPNTGTTVPSPPSGYSLVGSTASTGFYHVWHTGDLTSASFKFAAGYAWVGEIAIVDILGPDTGSQTVQPESPVGIGNTTTTTALASTSLTPTYANEMYFVTWVADSTGMGAWTNPPTMTSDTDILLQDNGSTVATLTVASSGTTCTFSTQAAFSVAIGHRLAIKFPDVPDATLASGGVTICGTR